ncbi:transglycosylase SLT domain-containing protein [Sneathiella sp.]|uniref:lytic transglycosylase domain-containing protein n=1 Tax=Sneathiella sp. TaxID=1964365 RepID=UPI0039E23C40
MPPFVKNFTSAVLGSSFLVAFSLSSAVVAAQQSAPLQAIDDDGIDRQSRHVPVPRQKVSAIPTPRKLDFQQASVRIPAASAKPSGTPLPRTKPGALIALPSEYTTGLLSKDDLKHYTRAFNSLSKRHWQQAISEAEKATYQLPAKYIRWSYVRAYKGGASFDDITSFVVDNPHWPYRETLMRRAEQALVIPVPVERTISWFADRTPTTGMGMLRYGEALIADGQTEKGIEWIKTAWIEGSFSEKHEKQFLKDHKSILSTDLHEARLDRLLWDRKPVDAIRMLSLVSKNTKKLAVARIRLMRMAKNVDGALAQIPKNLMNDPGLQFERAKWRRRKGKHDEAQEILLQFGDDAPRPEKWWTERHIQARKLLRMGHISDAYHLVSKHGLKSGGKYAEAEWMSGWISLRFLHDYKIAQKHFKRLYNNVSFPISRARGAYWLGRTNAILKDEKSARYWYSEAIKYSSTFYGQVALNELGYTDMPAIRKTRNPGRETITRLENNELVMVAKHLAELGHARKARPFLLRLTEQAKQTEEYVYLAKLAEEIGRQDYAVTVAKRASQLGTELTDIAWPTTTTLPDNPPIEVPLILAITRQESAFAEDAISHAGARGLMQLMPATARAVSRRLKVPYTKSRLTSDPAYNTLLGSTYLGRLIDNYDGSYILAIASYNAGSSRVRQWISEWGDPRTGDIDVIDWIELIPFSETRNYVQRVLENLQVYRQLLGNTGYRMVQIDEDLTRGSPTF